MTDQKSALQPTRPAVSGVPTPPHAIHGLDSPHIELLARLALGGGLLTPFETREICAAIVRHLEGG